MQKKVFSGLGQGHLRAIATTLMILDEALCQFEQWAHSREIRSVLYAERNSLSPDQRQAVLREIAPLRDMLRELRDVLELSGKIEDAKTLISSRCSVLWTDLVELESTRLRRYGNIPPGFAEYFDPKVARLIEHLQDIVKAIQAG